MYILQQKLYHHLVTKGFMLISTYGPAKFNNYNNITIVDQEI